MIFSFEYYNMVVESKGRNIIFQSIGIHTLFVNHFIKSRHISDMRGTDITNLSTMTIAPWGVSLFTAHGGASKELLLNSYPLGKLCT